MRYGFAYMMSLVLLSCQQKATNLLYVQGSSKEISITNDVVYYQQELFTGMLFELNNTGKDTILLQQYKDGVLDGVSTKWYNNHQLMEYRMYSRGKKNGPQIAYWTNGNKRFEFTAIDDAYEGELKEWSVNGNLFHLAHYVNGQEEGSQKMWYENGKIRANYVIKKGKRYGLLGTKNCKNVSDSIFTVQ